MKSIRTKIFLTLLSSLTIAMPLISQEKNLSADKNEELELRQCQENGQCQELRQCHGNDQCLQLRQCQGCGGCQKYPTNVYWQSLGDVEDENGWHYVQRITVTGDKDFRGLAFNQFARKMTMVNPLDTLTEIVPGYYLITSPRFNNETDSVVIEIDTRGFMMNCSYQPDGFHRVLHDNTSAPVNTHREPLTNPDIHHAFQLDAYPRAEQIYDFNESLITDWKPGVYDILPSFSSIKLMNNGKTVQNPVIEIVTGPEYYVDNAPEHATITVANNKVTVTAANERAAKTAKRVFEAKVIRPNNGKPLPEAVLTFNPKFEWRGMMIDIARNFQTPETLKDILDLMADNGLNKLHFHPVDDEAWRIEMPSLPELTEVGSRRGWGLNEDDHLYQIFTGDGNPDNYTNTSNGRYTKDEFIDVLRHAYHLGIDVVTEIESPGHARAAIRAMEKRAKNGDASYRLIEDNDTSVYTSAQSFHDNVMNPALESTYKFMETVIKDIKTIYEEAGVPLTGIHIGGDEIARNGWSGASKAQKFMKDNDIADERELHAYFVRRIAKILKDNEIPMYGWQEIALDHGAEYDAEIAPLTGGVNSWSTLVKEGQTPVPVKSVMGGYPTILSNVNHFYFDLSYSAQPQEPGLSWGGHTNEFTAFNGYADVLCPAPADAKGRVIGLNAHLFAETFRSADQLLMYITPKIFGLAERAAHPDTTYTEAQFNTIIGTKELPQLEERYKANNRGYVHVNQPGIKIIDDIVYMNAPYEGLGLIRYTTDGTEPDENSPIYTSPFARNDNTDIRARYYVNSSQSVTTYSKR